MIVARFKYITKDGAEEIISVPHPDGIRIDKQALRMIAIQRLDTLADHAHPIQLIDLETIPFAFKKVYEDANIPVRMHHDDAGYDLFLYEDATIYPKEVHQLGTGVMVQLPPHSVGFINPRSGLALRKGLDIINSPGTIDANYRGELIVLARTVFEKSITLKAGDRIAQFVPLCLLQEPPRVIYDELIETDRGSKGFGSTDSGTESESDPVFSPRTSGATHDDSHGDDLSDNGSDDSDSEPAE